jgi:hypothetical protein
MEASCRGCKGGEVEMWMCVLQLLKGVMVKWDFRTWKRWDSWVAWELIWVVVKTGDTSSKPPFVGEVG